MDKNKIAENAKKLIVNSTSIKMMKESFNEILPSIKNKNICTPSCIALISVVFALIIGFSNNTVSILKDFNSTLSGLILALFAIVFTGYTFFQVLISPMLLQRLLQLELENGDSYLKDSNIYFMHVMNINICIIVIDLFVTLVLFIMPDNFCLFNIMLVNELVCCVLLFVYLYFNIYCIWEIKSFVFNLYQFFNLSASENALSILNGSNDDKENS